MGKALAITALIALGSFYGCGGAGGGGSGGGGAGSGASVRSAPAPLAFSSWSSAPFGQPVQLGGIAQEVPYTTPSQGNIQTVDTPSPVSSSASLVLGFLDNSPPQIDLLKINTPSGSSIGAGGINIDAKLGCSIFFPCFATGGVTPGRYLSLSYLDATPGFNTGASADPYVLKWEHQTFGIWNMYGWANLSFEQFGPNHIGGISAGSPSAGSSIPLSGTATFTGKLAGYYISTAGGKPQLAGADVNVNVNFATRSLSLSSTSTALEGTPAPNLDLTGTLTYAAQTNSFTGTLTNAGNTISGTLTGRFYGPAAQELGGIFALRATGGMETLTGAYGAKQ